jgi:phosphotransferase system  glucose/maltose/N-acetylglucosamine-specific IIC component
MTITGPDTWYDYIIPTSLFGAIMFGTILSIIFAIYSKKESESWLRFTGTLVSGLLSTLIVATALNVLGYFN